jgi:23S rRNA (cytosine1962-C5)-methyltransferase
MRRPVALHHPSLTLPIKGREPEGPDLRSIMFEWPDYELLDFGEGRKLERFGTWVISRPSPAAGDAKWRRREDGRRAGFIYADFAEAKDRWCAVGGNSPFDVPPAEIHARPTIDIPLNSDQSMRMTIQPLPSGQVGVFPEQFANWQWIARQVTRVLHGATPGQSPGLKVLNLFGYTGGSTLAAACGGAAVVHVDAAPSSVAMARENAKFSGLAERPIRWIVEDAVKFCRREVKRGNSYDAVILDPPTYGHGPKGEEWLIKRDLLPLLELCGELVERRPKFVLLTCHTPGIGPAELAAYLADGVFGHCGQPPRTGELALETADGRRLPSGVFARWPA